MKFRLTGQYGEMSLVRDFHPHSGIDFAMPEGTTLRSISNGIVDRVFDGTTNIGKGVSIQLPDGTRTIYGHMSDVKTHVGEHIHAGEIIGLSGNTGNSTGPHLHFGMKDASGHFIDPTPLADKISNFAGNDFTQGVIPKLMGVGGETLREHAQEVTKEIVLGICDAVKDFLLEATIIGSAVMMILKVAGWKDGGRWTGILLVTNILLKFAFGVY
jgi:hypothetical protein